MCVSCDAKYGGITAGKHNDTHALVQCRSLQCPMDAESKHPVELNPHPHMSSLEEMVTSINERVQQIDEFLQHPVKAARALGAKSTTLLPGCVHG